jgi:hypothetical protein
MTNGCLYISRKGSQYSAHSPRFCGIAVERAGAIHQRIRTAEITPGECNGIRSGNKHLGVIGAQEPMSMERTEVLDMMGTLKLFGMKGAYDETLATAIKRKHEPQRFVGDLLRAEISEINRDWL